MWSMVKSLADILRSVDHSQKATGPKEAAARENRNKRPSHRKRGPGRYHVRGRGRKAVQPQSTTLERARKRAKLYMHSAVQRRAEQAEAR